MPPVTRHKTKLIEEETLMESIKMTQPVVLLERITQSEIDYYTSTRRRRPERRKKTEAYKNLRDVERVDFSLYDEYRQKRKSFLKKSEKKKRTKKVKISPNTEYSCNEVPNASSSVSKSNEAKKLLLKVKKRKEKTSAAKPKKKLRRVVVEDSDSDSNVENYGLVYEGGNAEQTLPGYNYYNSFNTVPPQYIDYDYISPATVNETDILTALAIGPKNDFDFQENQLDIPDDVDISKYSAISENEEELSAFTSRLIESVTSDCSTEDFVKQWDVVGGILNQMDSSYSSRKAKVPNSDPVIPNSSLSEIKSNFNVFNKENISHNLNHREISGTVSDDVKSEVSKVLDTLLKKVSVRMKRFLTLSSKKATSLKHGNKTCSLCRSSFMQIKNETMCITCKAYAVNQLSSGPKNSNFKKFDKQLTPPPKSGRFSPIKRVNKSNLLNNFNRHSPQRLKSSILLSSPIKPSAIETSVKHDLKTAPKIIPKKKSGLFNFSRNHSLNRAKITKRTVLKNLAASERHRLLYKNKNLLEGNKTSLSVNSEKNVPEPQCENMSDHNYTFRHPPQDSETNQSENVDSSKVKSSSTSNQDCEDPVISGKNDNLKKSKVINQKTIGNGLTLTLIDCDKDVSLPPKKSPNKPSSHSQNSDALVTENSKKNKKIAMKIKFNKKEEKSESSDTSSLLPSKTVTNNNINTVEPLSINSETHDSIICNYVLPTSTIIRAKYAKKDEDYCLENVEAFENNVDQVVSQVKSSTLNKSSVISGDNLCAIEKDALPSILNSLSSALSVTSIPETSSTDVQCNTPEEIASNLPEEAVISDTNKTDTSSGEQNSISYDESPKSPLHIVSESESASEVVQIISENKDVMKRDLIDINGNKKCRETVLVELEAFAILSVIDLEQSIDNIQLYIERLLRKEIRNLNYLKNILTASNEDLTKSINTKIETSHHKIKCLMFACILWTKCGSLEKVKEFVLSKQISKVMTTANNEFESKKHDSDLESWFSRNLAIQAKKEKFSKSDCMFSGNSSSGNNSPIPSSNNNASRILNNFPPAPPFIEDSFTDFTDSLPDIVNPKLETAGSCMFNSNMSMESTAMQNSKITGTMPSSAMQNPMIPSLEQLQLPSPLQSPIVPLNSPSYNTNVPNNQLALPAPLQSMTSQTSNQYDSNINNVPMMSTQGFQVQSQSVRNYNTNFPQVSPQSLQSASPQSFNQLDSNSFMAQNHTDSRRNSRNSTSSGEIPLPQMSPVHIKQERLDKSPCPTMNNALVPYNFFPTPSPTPPQPQQLTTPTQSQNVSQTHMQQQQLNVNQMQIQPYNSQNQQISQNQLQLVPRGQFQQLPQDQTHQLSQGQVQQYSQFQQFQNRQQVTHGQIQQLQLQQLPQRQQNLIQSRPQSQQISPQYSSLLKQLRYQVSNAPVASTNQALGQLLPVILNQAASQQQRNMQRQPAPNKTVPFGTVLQPVMNRNVPTNQSMQGGFNLTVGANNSGPPNVSLQAQNSNSNVNRTVSANLSVQLQQPNINVNNSNVNQTASASNNLVLANQPVNLQQILLTGGVSSGTNSQVSNFVVPYSNSNNTYNSSQTSTTARQQTVNSNSNNNMLFSMLSPQPQPNVYTVDSQSRTPANQQPPPSYNSTMLNTQNNLAVVPHTNNTQRDKQMTSPNLMYCAVCSKPATMRCKQCTKVVYCNATCARIYWHQKHKMECKATC